jgi:hypothetical protein
MKGRELLWEKKFILIEKNDTLKLISRQKKIIKINKCQMNIQKKIIISNEK